MDHLLESLGVNGSAADGTNGMAAAAEAAAGAVAALVCMVTGGVAVMDATVGGDTVDDVD